MLKRLPLRDRTLALAFLVAALLYGAKATFEATSDDVLMVDKVPVACDRSHHDCSQMDVPSETHLETDQLG